MSPGCARAPPPAAAAADAAGWNALADAIMADAADCLHPSGRWQRAPDDPGLDASLLLPAIRGALPATDPRSLATLAAIHDELADDLFVYRFRQDARPLGAAEGAFVLCGFLMALAATSRATRWRRPVALNATGPPAAPPDSCRGIRRHPAPTARQPASGLRARHAAGVLGPPHPAVGRPDGLTDAVAVGVAHLDLVG